MFEQYIQNGFQNALVVPKFVSVPIRSFNLESSVKIFERLSRQILGIDEVTTLLPTTKRIVPVKFYNKSIKTRVFMLSRGLEP